MSLIEARRRQGILLVLGSVIAFSFAGLYTKAADTSAYSILFWRSISSVIVTFGFIMWRKDFKIQVSCMGKSGLWVAIIGALATAAFVPAFKFTSVANVSLIYATCPLIAGVIAWLWIRESMSVGTIAGCFLALIGAGIIVSGSLEGLNLTGDFLALIMTVLMALMVVLYRVYPNTPSAGPAMLSSLLLIVPSLVFGNPFAISLNAFLLSCAFGVTFSVAAVTLAEGARRLPAAQTGLLSSLEMIVAPALAWLFLAEVAPTLSIIGGAIILAAVLLAQFSKAGPKTQKTQA